MALGLDQSLSFPEWPLADSVAVLGSVQTVLTGNDSKVSVLPALETLGIVEVEQLLDTDD